MTTAWQSLPFWAGPLGLPLWFGTLAFLGVYFQLTVFMGANEGVPALPGWRKRGAALEQS